MGQIEIKINETKKIDYYPCVKCGSDEIDFDHCGYTSFNVAWGKCRDCNNTVKISPCDWNITIVEIVEQINKVKNWKPFLS